MVTKTIPLSFEDVSALLAYDPDTGLFTWKVDASKNVKAGSSAGCLKGARTSRKTGKTSRYLYIRVRDFETPAARVAWLLSHGVWPEGNVGFKDGDSANLRLGNLVEAQFMTTVSHGEAKSRKLSKDRVRHYTLKRYYDMELAEYQQRLLTQNGVCAICSKPETAVLHGRVKGLSVDHDHATGAIRDLLCAACNHLLGHANDDRNVLLAAIKYLDKHAATANVVPLDTQKEA